MPWFTIMTVIVVILAVFGLITLAKYLINYSKKAAKQYTQKDLPQQKADPFLVYVCLSELQTKPRAVKDKSK
jgi:hypothetical protein